MLYRFFFFQAEDGIRDGHVTGVQTCALPILPLLLAIREDEYMKQSVVSVVHNKPDDIRLELRQKKLDVIIGSPRSEERRVGKECRSGWWRSHGKGKGGVGGSKRE